MSCEVEALAGRVEAATRIAKLIWRNVDDGDGRMAKENIAQLVSTLETGATQNTLADLRAYMAHLQSKGIDMTDQREAVAVEQIDRDAAANYGLHCVYSYLGQEMVRDGRSDDALVQAFARHRLSACADAEQELAEWKLAFKEALR